MKKRLLSGLMAAVMVLSLSASALAADTAASAEDAAQVLSALGILSDGESGDLSAPVTRAEFVKMLVAASSVSVGEETYVSPYPDVPSTHWAAPYVEAAVSAGYVGGYLDGTFRPDSGITLAEGVVMVLRLLGYKSNDFSGSFPAGQMSMYKTLGLDKGIAIGQNDAMTRRDAVYLFYNLLTVKVGSGEAKAPYVTAVLGHTATADGRVDAIALLNETMDGPVVVGRANWESKIPFDISNATVSRNGSVTTADALVNNDVVYWSKSTSALWVYTNKVTGPIHAIAPTSAPTSVTVSGKAYAIGTSEASYALSDLGSFQVGDTVTLLLGRDGKAVAAVPPGEAGGAISGLVISSTPRQYTDKSGSEYTASSVEVLATDGNTYTYRTERAGIRAGTLITVTTTDDGVAVKNLSSSSISGKVNAAGTRLGEFSFASDVEILDTYADRGVRVYPSRLAGMEITSDMVRYYLLNGDGEVCRLILKDATGDMHTYGVITSVSEINIEGSMTLSGTYDYDVSGVSKTLTGGRIFNLKTGPFLMKTNGVEADRFVNLTGVKITGVDGMTAYADNRQYAIWNGAIVYEVRDHKYYLTSLDLVAGGDYSLTGYYDKAQRDGGRIRVILAR